MYLYRHEKRYFSVFISVAEAFSFIKLGGNNQMKKKYHEISLAKKFSFTSIIIIFFTILSLTILIRVIYEKSVLNITSESYKEKFQIISDNSQNVLENAEKIAKALLTDDAIQNWFLLDSEENADQIKYKMQVERRLDYLDALYSDKEYSSISLFDSYGHIVNSNSIRSESQKYEKFFSLVKENYNVKWIDLYNQCIEGYEKKGIGYIRYYRDCDTGIIKGYLMIEYQSPLLINNFTHIKNGEQGKYVIADMEGNTKIENDKDISENIGDKDYFKWAITNQKGGKVFNIDEERYLVTTSEIPTLNWIMIGLTPVKELTRAGRNIIQIIYMVGFISVLLNIIFSLRVAYSVTKPLTELTRTMSSFGKGNLSVKVPVLYMDEIGTLSEAFNKMAEKIRQLIEQVYQEQKAKRKLELAALQAQINPHFLYNTLNSVSSLIQMECLDDAFVMIQSIGTFYRTSLSDGKTLISIQQEMINIENYIKIQEFRYGNKIIYKTDIEEEILKEWIVKLTLQPLVENAIYHGVKEKRGQGIIEIKGWKENNKVYITVSDNGTGIPKEKLIDLFSMDTREKESAFGLFNIQQRLQIYFGKEYGLHLESKEGQGTIATVCLPVGFKKEIEKNESISG